MKVLCVSHYYPPHVGGLEIVAKKMAMSLVKDGHTARVVTCASGVDIPGTTDESGVVVHRAPAFNIFDVRLAIPFPIPRARLIRQLWSETSRADVIHLHDVFYITSWLAYIFGALKRKPIFLTQHVAIVAHPSSIVMRLQRAVYATWGSWIFRYCSTVIAYNDTVRDFLMKRGVQPEKIHQLRNGVDLSVFRPAQGSQKADVRRALGLPMDKPLVLFVGRFVPKKGIAEAYNARSDAYDIVFAGSGSVHESWRKTSGVHFVGPQTQSQLAELYRACDVFLLPARGELFTLAMQEACASGLPVVTTDEPNYKKHGIDRDLLALVEPVASELKRTLEDIFADDARRASMSQYSLRLAKEWFDWDVNIQELLELYRAFEKKKQREVIVTTSWDDGHVLDIPLSELLKKYGIAGTFFISPENRELSNIERLGKKGVLQLATEFEIGAHTLTHPYLPDVDDKTAEREVAASKEVLESWIRRPIFSFCYPKGGYTAAHERIVRDLQFTHARTTERFSLKRGRDVHAMPTTIHTYDHWSDAWQLLLFVRFSPLRFFRLYRRWDEQAIALFESALENGGIFHLWGHSWEIEKHNDWARLEKVLKHIARRKGVQYLRFGQV